MTAPASQVKRWSSGDQVIFRQVWPAGVWAAWPATVVEDSTELISVYIAPGTTFAGPACTREEHLRVVASGKWELGLDEWVGQHHLWTAVPREACSIWTMWSEPGWKHLGWKVNAEAPIKRSAIGFDTTDHVLDAVIGSDLSSWEWKDEDEFAEAIERGLFTASEGNQIRETASRVANDALTTRRHELGAWGAWRPPPTWRLPSLGPGWQVV